MPEEQISKHLICPYYQAARTGVCQMTLGGLYIPLPAHIEIFCLTIKYSFCPQYIRAKALLQKNIRQNDEIIDSRKPIQRIGNRFSMAPPTCEENGRPGKIVDRRQNTDLNDSRRRFPRICNRFPIAISTCDEKGRPVQLIDSEALTLDLSLGGVKISSNSEIPINKILHFSFREDFHHSPVTGVGEVRWCRNAEGPHLFQAGLSFLDNTLHPTVGERLGLH